jgi:hypothetical protein
MVRSRVHGFALLSALAAVAACVSDPGTLRTGAGSAFGSLGGESGGSSGGSSSILGTAGGVGTNCGEVAVPTSPSPVDVMILLDASGSMNDDVNNTTCDGGCGTSSKWAVAAAVINAIVAETAASLNWGLMLFGDASAAGCGVPYPAQPVAANDASAIAAAISGRTSSTGGLVYNNGQSPTAAGVSSATGFLTSILDNRHRMIVLITDGAPNCGAGDPKLDDSGATIAAIDSAWQAGFPTFVVGLSTAGGPADAALSRMAIAGGLARSGSPAYSPASDASVLVSVLGIMAASAASCVYAVPPPPNVNANRQDIAVKMDGAYVPIDPAHANGWDFTDGTRAHVQFYGPPCDTLTRQPAAHAVAVDFLCLIR